MEGTEGEEEVGGRVIRERERERCVGSFFADGRYVFVRVSRTAMVFLLSLYLFLCAFLGFGVC